MCLYCMISYQSSIKRAVINVVLVYVMFTIMQTIVYLPLAFLMRRNQEWEVIAESLTISICLIVFMLFGSKLRLNKVTEFLAERNKLLFILGICVCGMLGMQILSARRDGIIYAKDYIEIIYFIVLFVVLLLEWQKAKTDAEKKKVQLEMNRLYYDAYEGLIQSIREKQHDFKNHINAISGMLYANDNIECLIEKQREYFEDMLGNLDETSLLTLVENPLLSGFLVRKIQEAEARNIEVEKYCCFEKQELRVPEYNLVEMMGILIDNAMEAAERIKQGSKMRIKLWKEENMFCFSVMNCYQGEKLSMEIFDKNYSTKGRDRGLGLTKLKRIQEEVNGELHMVHGKLEDYKTVCFEIRIPI